MIAKLQNIPNAPKHVWIRGVMPPDTVPWLAVVGTRRHSKAAPEIVERLVAPLARAGVVIVSGLAYGIDTLAHSVCLAAGGLTVAVLGSGLDRITPGGNRTLAKEIFAKGGALVSEYPADTPAYKGNFLARNRIIAALADATLVVEAPFKSGALATARCAVELGRPVLAVPGSILAETSAGTNMLLRRGAIAVTSANDIAEALKMPKKLLENTATLQLDDQSSRVLAALSHEPLPVDRIAAACILEPSVTLAALTRLELAGLARNLGGMVFVRRSPT